MVPAGQRGPVRRRAAVNLARKIIAQERLRAGNIGDLGIVRFRAAQALASSYWHGARHDWRRRGVQDTAEGGAVAILLVITLGIGVGSGADNLENRLGRAGVHKREDDDPCCTLLV